MLNTFKQIMINQYFGKHFSLDYRVCMIFFFESYFISILSAITNTALNKGLPGIILQWSYILFCTIMIFVTPQIRRIILKPNLLFVTFFYIPFLYFQTAGYDGTALLFTLLGIFMLGIVFSGKTRIVIIGLNILDYLLCIIISYLYPQTVIPHSGPYAMLIDLIVAFILSSVGLSILTLYISRVFEDNRKVLAELSIRDALTGTYNRRFMTDFLHETLNTFKRTGNKFYVLMLDIDHFKKINDTYGHGFGDRVLLECARTIQRILRKGDVIARYGGEEFAIILSSDMPINAVDIAERIRHAITLLRFKHNITVTVSIGLAESKHDDTIETLMNRADKYMYYAKQAGRNKVSISN